MNAGTNLEEDWSNQPKLRHASDAPLDILAEADARRFAIEDAS